MRSQRLAAKAGRPKRRAAQAKSHFFKFQLASNPNRVEESDLKKALEESLKETQQQQQKHQQQQLQRKHNQQHKQSYTNGISKKSTQLPIASTSPSTATATPSSFKPGTTKVERSKTHTANVSTSTNKMQAINSCNNIHKVIGFNNKNYLQHHNNSSYSDASGSNNSTLSSSTSSSFMINNVNNNSHDNNGVGNDIVASLLSNQIVFPPGTKNNSKKRTRSANSNNYVNTNLRNNTNNTPKSGHHQVTNNNDNNSYINTTDHQLSQNKRAKMMNIVTVHKTIDNSYIINQVDLNNMNKFKKQKTITNGNGYTINTCDASTSIVVPTFPASLTSSHVTNEKNNIIKTSSQVFMTPLSKPLRTYSRQKSSVNTNLAVITNANGVNNNSSLGPNSSTPIIAPSNWSLLGVPEERLIYLRDDEQAKRLICYPAIKHTEGDVIHVRDSVLLRSGAKNTDLPYIAKICAFWEDPKTNSVMMSLYWYYRPEHTEEGRKKHHLSDEIFASRHKDVDSVECIEDKCYVLTFNEYCRYKKRCKMEQYNVPWSLTDLTIPVSNEPYPRRSRIPDSSVSQELIFCCRQIYDSRLRRLMKNPLISPKYGHF